MKKENLQKVNLICKQIDEKETDISSLDLLILELRSSVEMELDKKLETSTVELGLSTRGVSPNPSTVYHVFTFNDIIEMANNRKSILAKEVEELLDCLEKL